MLVKPIAGWIADTLDKHKLVFLMGVFFTGAGYFCLQFIPEIEPDSPSHVDCSNPYSLLKVSTNIFSPLHILEYIIIKTLKICRDDEDVSLLRPHLNSTCPLVCHLTCTLSYQPQICSSFNLENCTEDSTVHFSVKSNLSRHETIISSGCLYLTIDEAMSGERSVMKPTCPEKTVVNCQTHCDNDHLNAFIRQDSVFQSSMFWVFFLLNMLAYSAMCVVNSMGDAIAFTLLGDRPGDYGSQRVWGSIGWGLFTIIAGYMVDSGSSGPAKDYTPAFYLLGGLLLLNLLVTGLSLRIVKTERSKLVFTDILSLLSQLKVVVFVFWCILCGMLTSLVWHFLPWYLSELASDEQSTNCDDQAPGWMTLLLGLNLGLQCFVGEVPMFFISGSFGLLAEICLKTSYRLADKEAWPCQYHDSCVGCIWSKIHPLLCAHKPLVLPSC